MKILGTLLISHIYLCVDIKISDQKYSKLNKNSLINSQSPQGMRQWNSKHIINEEFNFAEVVTNGDIYSTL